MTQYSLSASTLTAVTSQISTLPSERKKLVWQSWWQVSSFLSVTTRQHGIHGVGATPWGMTCRYSGYSLFTPWLLKQNWHNPYWHFAREAYTTKNLDANNEHQQRFCRFVKTLHWWVPWSEVQIKHNNVCVLCNTIPRTSALFACFNFCTFR